MNEKENILFCKRTVCKCLVCSSVYQYRIKDYFHVYPSIGKFNYYMEILGCLRKKGKMDIGKYVQMVNSGKAFFNTIWWLAYLTQVILIKSNVYLQGFIRKFPNHKMYQTHLNYFFYSLNSNVLYFTVRKMSFKNFQFFTCNM